MDEKLRARRAAKPSEWRALFGSGNTDDHFRLGIKITRGSIRCGRGSDMERGWAHDKDHAEILPPLPSSTPPAAPQAVL